MQYDIFQDNWLMIVWYLQCSKPLQRDHYDLFIRLSHLLDFCDESVVISMNISLGAVTVNQCNLLLDGNILFIAISEIIKKMR